MCIRDSYEIELKPNKEHEITVTNTKMETHSTKCKADISYKEYFKCAADKMGQKIQDCKQWKKHCKKHINTDLKCDAKDCQGPEQPGNTKYLDNCSKKIKLELGGVVQHDHSEKNGKYEQYRNHNSDVIIWVKNLHDTNHGSGECTTENPCGEHEGHCDSDDECQGNLLCGLGTCPESYGSDSDKNCCYYPGSSSCGNPGYKGDDNCDDENNNEGCAWDGGDCCGNDVNTQYCSYCDCLDPYENIHMKKKKVNEPKHHMKDSKLNSLTNNNLLPQHAHRYVSISFDNDTDYSSNSGRFYINKHVDGNIFQGIRSNVIPANSKCPTNNTIKWEFYKLDQNGNGGWYNATSDVKLYCKGDKNLSTYAHFNIPYSRH